MHLNIVTWEEIAYALAYVFIGVAITIIINGCRMKLDPNEDLIADLEEALVMQKFFKAEAQYWEGCAMQSEYYSKEYKLIVKQLKESLDVS